MPSDGKLGLIDRTLTFLIRKVDGGQGIETAFVERIKAAHTLDRLARFQLLATLVAFARMAIRDHPPASKIAGLDVLGAT